MVQRTRRLSYGRRAVPLNRTDASLRLLRVSKCLKASEIGRWYGVKGVSRARISQIENSVDVSARIRVAYILAVKRAATSREAHFENLKIRRTAGR